MRVSHRVALCASLVVVVMFSLYSWMQYNSVKTAFFEKTSTSTQETSTSLALQINNWLNSKLTSFDAIAQTIDADFSRENILNTFNTPIYNKEFLVLFGGLDTDGKAITNSTTWTPSEGWDARKRPWYPIAQKHNRAVFTDPYADYNTGEIIISVVANITDKGTFKGVIAGDLSLKEISEAVNTLNFNGAGYAFLLDKNGTIVTHPNGDLNSKPITDLIQGGKPAFSSNLIENKLLDGTEVFTSYNPLPNLYGTDWYIGVVLDKSKVLKDVSDFGWTALFSTLISALVCSIILYFLAVRLLQPLQALRESLQKINSGDGDLTKRLEIVSNDEFGEVSADFNTFIDYLQKLIVEIKSLSSEVRINTDKTESSSAHSASELQIQLSELDQLATAMHQMSATAHDVADSAQTAADRANKADIAAQEGVNIVNRTTTSIIELTDQMGGVVSTINELVNYSNNIESILTVITDIADQTNLLALNAAIEAARAGEQGRGFAVVADEVRTLASKTQESTEQIQKMINQLQVGVRNAEEVILQSRENANATQSVADEASVSLNAIRESIVEINNMNVQIATAAEEQSATSNEINRNTTNIRDISQSVSESAKNQEALCNTMVDLTNQQSNALDKFKV
ncbi:methyl-accepting chemotaxis protein [Marinomonas sp. 2405UD68-3]|uniref:methyl-accepting chemotaxis protein n=1 Tax=Marinomonas sp. 2405UD68-3 TaxID=3391835 RepID=UPI0039C9BBA9